MTTVEPNAQPRATLIELPMQGEPATDKAYRCVEDGRTYRVRVLPVAASNVDGNGNVITDIVMAVDITITRLESDGSVSRNADGSTFLVAQTRWTIQSDTIATDDPMKSPQATLQRILEQLIYSGSLVTKGQEALAGLLSAWGSNVGAVAAVSANASLK